MQQPRTKGFFLCLEGPDGAGKTTVRHQLNEWFTGIGHVPVLTREPGGTPVAEKIRDNLLLRTHDEPLSPMAETLLFMAAREIHLTNMINPCLNEGRLVITDRFCDSTFCYQGAGRGMDLDFLIGLHKTVFGDDTFPDMTFILDGDPVFFHKRMLDQRGGDEMNHFDEIGFEFKNKSRLMYRHLAATYPERYVVIDAEQSLEQVMAQMVPHLMQIDAHLRKRPSE